MQAALAARPVRALDDEILGRFAAKALSTWGRSEDLRYHLPRLLELAHAGTLACELVVLLGKLQDDGWATVWPAAEHAAVRAVLESWWQEALETYPGRHDVPTLLCALARTTDELAPYMARFTAPDAPTGGRLAPAIAPAGPAASTGLEPTLAVEPAEARLAPLRHLAAFLRSEVSCATRVTLVNAHWGPAAERCVLCWLAAPELARHVERAAYAHPDGPIGDELAVCYDDLRWVQGATSDMAL
jgi:hypothetical protein